MNRKQLWAVCGILGALFLGTGCGSKKAAPSADMKATLYFLKQLAQTTTGLGAKGSGPIPIRIGIEDIPGHDGYRLAIAELIRAQFSSKFEVSANQATALVVYVSGTDSIRGVRSIDVSVRAVVYHYFVAGDRTLLTPGTFVFAEHGQTLRNYSNEEATQVVREMAYKVLSEAQGKLEKSAEPK